MIKARVVGTGSYVPERVMTNFDLEKFLDTSDDWIVTRTGIRERHVAAEGEMTSDLATKAARRALAMAGHRGRRYRPDRGWHHHRRLSLAGHRLSGAA